MQPTTQPDLVDSTCLRSQLQMLASVAPSDAPFLSCYLDARAGREACLDFLEQKGARIRASLSGTALLYFDSAYAMLVRELDQAWHPDMQGIALFARGPAGGRWFSRLCFALPLDNRLAFYRVPEILPLLDLGQREPDFNLLLARQGRVQLLDVDLGVVTPRACAFGTLHRDARSADGALARHTREPVIRFDHPLQRVRRVVSSQTAPLVIAADAAELELYKAWLPRRASSRLYEEMALSLRMDQRAVVVAVRSRLAAARRGEAALLVARLVRATRAQGAAVAGQLATMEALRDGEVETLLVTETQTQQAQESWDAAIELSRLALQRGIRVIPVDSDELRYLGGVGCLLRQRSDGVALPTPAARTRLDLVA